MHLFSEAEPRFNLETLLLIGLESWKWESSLLFVIGAKWAILLDDNWSSEPSLCSYINIQTFVGKKLGMIKKKDMIQSSNIRLC